jgi:pilus assembly protein Flp/PilA
MPAIALVKRFWRDESAAVAIEYGLMAALLAVSAIAAFTFFGNSLKNLFSHVENKTTNPLNPAGI